MSREDLLHAGSVLIHVTDYLALAVLLGGLLFVSALWPAGAQDRRTRMILVVSVLAGVVGAIATVLLSAQYAVAGSAVVDVLEAPFGRTAAAMALLWLLAAVVVVAVLQRGEQAVRSIPWRVGTAAIAVGLLRTTGLNGHSAETADAPLGMVADFLHLGGVSAWVGGLTVLSIGLLARRKAAELADVVPKFSKFAMISVLAIVSSGVILGWQIIGSVGAVFETSYGRVLLIKLSVFALVLLAAMKSKNWVEKNACRWRSWKAAAQRSGRSRCRLAPRPFWLSPCSSRRVCSSRPIPATDVCGEGKMHMEFTETRRPAARAAVGRGRGGRGRSCVDDRVVAGRVGHRDAAKCRRRQQCRARGRTSGAGPPSGASRSGPRVVQRREDCHRRRSGRGGTGRTSGRCAQCGHAAGGRDALYRPGRRRCRLYAALLRGPLGGRTRPATW